MPNELDKSLLDRLNALRGNNAGQEKPASTEIKVDLIERKKAPTRDDTLAARLKSLRDRGDEPSPAPKSTQSAKTPQQPAKPTPQAEKAPKKDSPALENEEDESMFQTDDQTLEELLGDVEPEESFQAEPDDAQVKALLEQLADSIPQDGKDDKDKKDQDSDDSDGEAMNKDVDEVIARFRDEVEVEAALAKTKTPDPESESEPEQINTKTSDIALPDVPSDLADIPASNRAGSTDIDDLTARLAALRAPSPDEDSLALPSVPTSKPSGQPVNRLTSRTNYTDDDVDSWCTVCLEDATVRCPECDDDVYCTRCWYEMHRGPQAGFDERSHKAVQFTKDKKEKQEKQEKRKVALGA
ncbi:Zinc finger FYVE domain-containing protein 19 [Fusarium austroafricanum]|uniref:Zinc finger FYVE domain-containing protein 19 n=1 Tax=Fusarium austroafricanum TaxID=2364996 RepID=A0A8H4KKI1_9HYPO|nr:Zinc finger FYVE domain-containing protein 19 [Fusarium austroafricanum]